MESVLAFVGATQRKKAICFLISDFLCEIPEHPLTLIAKKHDLVAIRTSDPFESEFPHMGIVNLQDLETEKMIHLDTRQSWKSISDEKAGELKKVTQKIKAGLIEINTKDPYIKELKRFFKMREVMHR
jgi:hypothetical protein